MLKEYKEELKSLKVISGVCFALGAILLLMIPKIFGLIRTYFHSGAQFFTVAVYLYAIPLLFVLLGVSLIIIRKAILDDRFSAAWYIERLKKEGGRQK